MTEALHEVTITQFRILVVLTSTESLRIGALAERMSANVSTFSRTIDRMVTHGWVDRATSADSRREVLVSITATGRAIVDDVTARRRSELADILDRMPLAEQKALSAVLTSFAVAAGEPHSVELLVLGL
nr:MarR family transcriptional regulator [Herbiconiux sp. VKM Ac-2851]